MGLTPLGGRQVNPGHAGDRRDRRLGRHLALLSEHRSIRRGLKEMAEIVGVGTGQFDARGGVEDYPRWVHLVAAMLRGGFTPEEAGKIAGGNYLRIFRAAVG
jgi:membrane dipeptidase